MKSPRRMAFAGGIVAAATIASFTGCSSVPTDTSSASGGAASEGFLPCIVSDSAGFNDRSFNQLGIGGLTAATDALGIEHKSVESADDTVYASNISNLVDQGCNLVVTVGFLLADATKEASIANPDVNFAIVDDSSINAKNVKPLVFQTSQAAFLAGYAAAATSKSGIVGTYGGKQIPPITTFMDGFVEGVDYFNVQKGTKVRALGWDVGTQTGSFAGTFSAGIEAKTAAQTMIDQGADVLLPVGGPIFLSAGEAIRDSKKEIALIGVDADVYTTANAISDLFLTSVMKGVSVGVEDTVNQAAAGNFDSKAFVGTLENGGVGIAPFHDWSSKVPATLQSELDQVKAGIIAGTIEVKSPSAI